MTEQQITWKSGEPIVLDTPAGPVEIHRGDRVDRLMLKLPRGIAAFKTISKLERVPKYFRSNGTGGWVPSYSVVVPMTLEGNLIGIAAPKEMTLRQETKHGP